MATVTLRLSPNAAHVRTARLVATAMARHSGVDEEMLDDVRLAVGEACARAVHLHEESACPQPITLELADGDRFRVRVVETATGPAAPASSAMTGWNDPNGIALAMIRAVVNDLSVEPLADGVGSRVSMSWPADMTKDLMMSGIN